VAEDLHGERSRSVTHPFLDHLRMDIGGDETLRRARASDHAA